MILTVKKEVAMERTVRGIEKVLFKISSIAGWIGKLILIGIVILVILDVILRYFFNNPFAFSVELIEIALIIASFSAIVLCTAKREHLVIRVLSGNAVTDCLVLLLSISVFAIMTWRCFLYALQLRAMGNVSVLLKIPLYPFSLFISLCSFLITLMLLVQLLEDIVKWRQK